MLSLQMVNHARDYDRGSSEAHRHLLETSDEFDQNLRKLETGIGGIPIPSEDLEDGIAEVSAHWEGFQPHILALRNEGSTVAEHQRARTYFVDEGPGLAEASTRLLGELRRQAERSRHRIWRVMVAAVFFNLGLVLVGYFLIRFYIVAPLRNLEEKTVQLRGGKLEVRVASPGNDEIGRLGQAFNEMAREIEGLVKSLEERRKFAESVITHVPVGVLIHRDDELVLANQQLLSLLGIADVDEIPDKAFVNLFAPEDRAAAAAISTERTHRPQQLHLSSHHDEPRTVEVVTVSIEYEGGEASLTMLRDITERQRMTARMMQMDRVVAIGTLVAGVGHEINNPLSFVMANLDFSIRRLKELKEALSESQQEHLDVFSMVEEALLESQMGSERIRDIVARLRAFSRGDETSRQPVDVAQILESTIRMAHSEIHTRARLVRKIEAVPPVEANESQLGQVFLNLLINAGQAIGEGRADEENVTVSLCCRDGRVIVAISDTGSGISREAADRIFDPFFTTKPPGEGTGLGLSICQKIIEAHDGVITFESEAGQGTTFQIVLPAVEGSLPIGMARPGLQGNEERRKIILIDDEEMVGKTFQRILKGAHDVEVTTDPRHFLEALAAGERYDVVFCDLIMPDITGMEMYDILARDYPETLSRTIFMTGGAFTAQAEKFLKTVDPPLLSKPFDIDDLLERIAGFEAND
ncbi:MAG: ATP-binding protein [Bradymonadaceae bacterium]